LDMLSFMLLFLGAIGIGFVSSIGGIGGGSLMVPYMILVLGYDARTAIASSLVTIITTSCSAASVYFKKRLINLDVALILTPSTVFGAILGSNLNLSLPITMVKALLGATLIFISFLTLAKPLLFRKAIVEGGNLKYYDESLNRYVSYRLKNIPLGVLLSILGGFTSGMFGIGGGVIKVPVMVLVMGIPIKVAVATSSYMIGLTAATGSITYLAKGAVSIESVAALALGIIPGATLGAKAMGKLNPRVVQLIFSMIILYSGLRILISSMV